MQYADKTIPIDGTLSLSCDEGLKNWKGCAHIAHLQWNEINNLAGDIEFDSQVGFLACQNLRAQVDVGKTSLAICATSIYRAEQGGWDFDVCVADRFLDMARLSGVGGAERKGCSLFSRFREKSLFKCTSFELQKGRQFFGLSPIAPSSMGCPK